MMTARISLTLLAAAVLAVFATAGAHAEVIAHSRNTYTLTFTNPCNGERIELQCESHTVLRNTRNDNNHASTLGLHVDVQCEGTGDMGNEYVVRSAANYTAVSPSDHDDWGSHRRLDLRVVGKGDAPNFMLTEVDYVTYRDGELIVEVDELTTECVGGE